MRSYYYHVNNYYLKQFSSETTVLLKISYNHLLIIFSEYESQDIVVPQSYSLPASSLSC